MKTKTLCFSLLAVALALWATWSYAYNRGYTQGSQDELACWTINPSNENDSQPAVVMLGTRDIRRFPGGAPWPEAKARVRGNRVNDFSAVSLESTVQ